MLTAWNHESYTMDRDEVKAKNCCLATATPGNPDRLNAVSE
jgi:hypothetical protein